MTILDRSRTAKRIRIDATQLADELAKRMPDLEKTRDQATNAVHDAADQARHQIDRAAEIARVFRGDIAHSGDKVSADNIVDEITGRIRAIGSTTAARAVIARLERELPEVDRDKVQRAYARGRAQARSRYLFVGLLAGLGAGAVAALLLDPVHGKERRSALATRTSGLTKDATRTVSGKAKYVSDRARGLAIERGLVKPPAESPERPLTPVFAAGPVTDPSSTTWEPLPSAAGEAADAATAANAAPSLDAVGDRGNMPISHG